MSRMSAEEFLGKNQDERDWAMFDTLQAGHEAMTSLRTDVDGVSDKLDDHIEDPSAHQKAPNNPGNPGLKSRIRERKWQAIVGIITTITIIAGYYFGGG